MSTAKSSVLILSLLAAGASQAGVLDLTTIIGGANAYILHNYTAPSSDIEGALIAAGNVTLSSYSVNFENAPAFSQYALVAGGNLSLAGGSINHGSTYVGGTTSYANAALPPVSTVNPVNFAATSAYYKAVSTSLSKLTATGTVGDLWGGAVVTGSGKGANSVDVFNVNASAFNTSHTWNLENVTAGQTLIFNIAGSAGTFNNGGVSFDVLKDYNVLFNFYEATSVDPRGMFGSLLAPNATVSTDWGQVNGNIIVDNWNSTIQINANHFFRSVDVAGYKPVTSVPEPGTYAMLLAGLGLMGALVRRRRG